MKYIFYSIPAYGHVNPTLPLVNEICKNGNTVYYYSTDRFKSIIENIGAKYKKYDQFDGYNFEKASKNIGYLYYVLSKFSMDKINILLDEASDLNVDCIIHDAVAPWGRIIAEKLSIPAVSSIPTFVFINKTISFWKTLTFLHSVGLFGIMNIVKANKIQKQLSETHQIKQLKILDVVTSEEPLNIIYTSSYFQPNVDRLDNSKFKFIGPSFFKRPKSELIDQNDDTPIIYISLGTIWNNAIDYKVFENLTEMINCKLIISGMKNKVFKSTDNIFAFEYVDQISILQICDVFVTHCGMNSVNEALYYCVPLVAYPFQAEQMEVANRVVDLGCGIQIKKITTMNLYKAIIKILGNKRYKLNCKILSESLKQSGGSQKGYEFIKKYVE